MIEVNWRINFTLPNRYRLNGVIVEGVGEVALAPMKNPVTGEVHRAIIELPTGFEASRMEVASLEKLVVDDGYLNFAYKGTCGHFTETTWKGP